MARSEHSKRRSPVKLVASRAAGAGASGARAAPGLDRAKSSFMAAINHELRTPLNAIIGFAEIMDAELLGPIEIAQYREYVRDIRSSSRHLLRIIEDVLEISQAETGELVLIKREIDIAELVLRAIASFDVECLARRISIVTDLPEQLVIQVDPARIERAISCLLSNAVKFSRDGGEIGVAVELGTEDEVRIAIRDEGIGIAPSAIQRVFTPFVQYADNLSRAYDGAGLGLPLARKLAEMHGGTVTIASRHGQGRVATLKLPAYLHPFGEGAAGS